MKLLEYDSCRRFNIKRQARCFGARSGAGGVYGGVTLTLKNHRKIGISRTVILPNFTPLYRGDKIDYIPCAHTQRAAIYYISASLFCSVRNIVGKHITKAHQRCRGHLRSSTPRRLITWKMYVFNPTRHGVLLIFGQIEKQFAVKGRYTSLPLSPFSSLTCFLTAVQHMSTYWAILEKVKGSSLKLTKMDDDIYEHLKKDLPDFDPAATINEDEMKSKLGKEKWRNFMMCYDKKIDDYNFGTMLRTSPTEEYTQDGTIFGENFLSDIDYCRIINLG